jgi:hypothetical protein
MTDPRPAARALYADLNAARAQAEASGARILVAASARLDRVQADIKGLRPRAPLDEDAGKRYSDLILERARLRQVLLRGE